MDGGHAGAQAEQTHLPCSSRRSSGSLMSMIACLWFRREAEYAVAHGVVAGRAFTAGAQGWSVMGGYALVDRL